MQPREAGRGPAKSTAPGSAGNTSTSPATTPGKSERNPAQANTGPSAQSPTLNVPCRPFTDGTRGALNATIRGMSRVRISTTVDSRLLATARDKSGAATDAELMDRALTLLTRHLEEEHEREVLERLPYHLDAELVMRQAPLPDGLPYDGAVPADVQRLVKRRRRTQ